MFLGADKYKHEDYGHIKKCSQCEDTNLRYLGLWGGIQGLPIWLCGNGHIVYPFYDEFNEWFTYVIYEGNIPSFLIDGGIKQIPGGVGDYNCCDIPKSGVSKNVFHRLDQENTSFSDEYPCNVPNKLKISIDGVLGTYGNRGYYKHVAPPPCHTHVSSYPNYDTNPLPPDYRSKGWYADCGCIRLEGGCIGTYIPDGCGDPSCVVYCTRSSSITDNCGDLYKNADLKFWGPLSLGSIKNGSIKRSCNKSDYPDCDEVCGPETNYFTSDSTSKCNGSINLPACHKCGTLRCSDNKVKYRLPCSEPANTFTFKSPDHDIGENADFASKVYSLPHEIKFGTFGSLFPVCFDQILGQDFIVEILFPFYEQLLGKSECLDETIRYSLSQGFPLIIPGSVLETVKSNEGKSVQIHQPDCLRESNSFGGDINTEDICDQNIILDRTLPIRSDLMWTIEDQRGNPAKSEQAYIRPLPEDLGSDVEPELVAIIDTVSGVGGQVAFQTWPVSFDSDTLIENEYPDPDNPNICKSYRRPKSHGYGVMYPFIDDPIWKEDYNFPIFLPGIGYKTGEKIYFKFWQTLDGEPDPSSGEVFREVVAATATITEVDSNGGIVWYEFDGTPIAGDCPCTKDYYCGGLSSACYPDEHPYTEEGLYTPSIDGPISCYLGPICDTEQIDTCTLNDTIFVPGDCWPHKKSWEIGGNYGVSSCSGLAEKGYPKQLRDGAIIPGKADKYYYAWLPEPECFLSLEPLFLEYLAFDDFRYGYDFNGENFPGCSPLVKVYRDGVTGGYSIKTRFPNYRFSGPPCRKGEYGDSDTLFVTYQGGNGDVVNQNPDQVSTRTNDEYCRVYGFYQQKQYACDLTYQGEFIMRGQTKGYATDTVSCEPSIGQVTVNFSRKETKTDITISAPTGQQHLLTEYLPAPQNGIVKQSFPYDNGGVEKWQLYNPYINTPDPRNNCEINLKKYFTQNIIEYDCDERCFFEGYNFVPGAGWQSTWNCTSEGYREYEYIDVFGKRQKAWRNNFRDLCGYPWENTCKKKINEDFKDPNPECYIDENGELICDFLEPDGTFSDAEKDKCDPYCMLKNTSAIIAIKEIEPQQGCANSANLIGGENRSFQTICFGTVNYSHRIILTGTDITIDPGTGQPNFSECKSYGGFDGNENSFIVFAYGDRSVSASQLDAKIQEYLNIWKNRYESIGRGDLPGWRALYSSEPDDYPTDRNYDMFFSKIFEINGIAKVKVLSNICDMITYLGCNAINGIKTSQDFIESLFGEQLYTNGLGGRIKSISLLNPGQGYAFEVEERQPPTGIIKIEDIDLAIESEPKALRRKEETWSLSNYTLTHSGVGYEIGQTIPIIFNDSDAINGIVYKSYPTLEVTKVEDNGRISETRILNSGEYHKLIKTGEHRAYPITISINNYWEGVDGVTGLGRHAELIPEVDVKPSSINEEGVLVSNPNYGRIINVIVNNGGMDYFPNGKYWKIDTSFNGIGLEHLIDPCKYDLNALPAQVLGKEITGQYARPGGYRYVAPPLEMNGGNVLKWSDKALPWSTVIHTGNCPYDLMNRTYKMALTEAISLMPADCSGSECAQVKSSYDEYFNDQTIEEYTVCERFTAFYGHRFKLENKQIIPFTTAIGGIKTRGFIPPDPGGCDVRSQETYCANVGLVGYENKGNKNPSDPCSGATEYTIVGNWRSAFANNAWIPYHIHRVYKMGGNDITMKIEPLN